MADLCCKECGCQCRSCDQSALHLHVEIENLKQRLVERDRHIVTMETNFLSEADKFPDGEYAALTEELLTWQEKYSRLYESYKRVQKVNQGLEDKLLKVVDKFESEKAALTRDVASLTQRLVDSRFNVTRLQEENERYRNDLSLAIQFLQCKPANFVPQKFEQLPSELQQKVRTYMSSKRRPSDCNGLPPKVERRTIKVPIPTFPPTAMVYSVNKTPNEKDLSDEEKEIGDSKPPVDIVSAAILAKILEERERERLQTKHCTTCSCASLIFKVDISTQTEAHFPVSANNSPSSPALMNLRYSSSLLGSGEASQVLVSLADDSSCLAISSSQTSSAKQSPRNSITSTVLTTKSEEETFVSKKLTSLNNINKNFENTSWDDWNLTITDSQRIQDSQQPDPSTTIQMNDGSQGLSKKEINMPKVSMNNSPGFCRVNSTVMPSSAGTPLLSSWNKVESSALDPAVSKKLRQKGKLPNNQDSSMNSLFESLKGSDINSPTDTNIQVRESSKTDLNLQSNKTQNNSKIKLLPETKLFASGDTVEVHHMDSLMYSVECERRLGHISLKGISPVSNSSSSPSSEKREKEQRPSGPRPCSLRFQAGSNNILLDNAQSYEPILYTSRQASSSVTVTPAKVGDALVHCVNTRLESLSPADDVSCSSNVSDTTTTSSMLCNQKLPQRSQSNRTETGV